MDSILLYGGHHPIFVVDAYTKRVLERHDAVGADATYDKVRGLMEGALSIADPTGIDASAVLDPKRPAVHELSAMSMAAKSELAQTYSEMHGLFVQVGNYYCLKQNPKCDLARWGRC